MTSSGSYPRVTFGVIVLNGEPFLRYNLQALYPLAHQIIVVEGACMSAASLATKDGHSTDGTLETLRRFREVDDLEDKLIVVKAEDEGKPNGFWEEKDEMSQAYARLITGDWLWQVDSDEFYFAKDMRFVLDIVKSDSEISAVSFPFIQFRGGFAYREDGLYFRYRQPCVHRLFRWRKGYQYVKHRPPTVLDEQGRDLRSLKWISYRRMRQAGVYMHHYSCVFPKQAQQKVGYYAHVSWSDSFRHIERWLSESYYELKNPYFIGDVDGFIPQWLERYENQHPAQIVKIRQDLEAGTLKEPLRPVDDIERLLNSRFYRIGRWGLKVSLFILWNVSRLFAFFRSRIVANISNRVGNKISVYHPN